MTRHRHPAAEREGRERRRPGGDGSPSPSRWQAFYAVIARIPPGRVATYGQVASLAGYPGHARQVGYALAATPSDLELPWHRVINARGEVSPRADSGVAGFQRHLLEAEGVVFGPGGGGNRRVDLSRYGWQPAA